MTQETYKITWCDIEIEIAFKPNYLLNYLAHIEVKSKEILPITETGYRSIFLSFEEVEEEGGATSYVKALLNHYADSIEWKKHVEARKQGSLF